MAKCHITREHCNQEQSPKACIDCMASTRRCTHCDEIKPIKDAQKGLCANCSSKNGKKPTETQRQRGELDFEDVVTTLSSARMRGVRTPIQTNEGFDAEQTVCAPNARGAVLLDPQLPTAKAISRLPNIESNLIRLLLGFETNELLTLVGVAEVLGLSKKEVELHARNAISRLKMQLSPKDFETLKSKLPSMPKPKVNEAPTIVPNEFRTSSEATTGDRQPPAVQTTEPPDRILQAVGRLSERKAQIMQMRLGIGGNQPLTLREISQRLQLDYNAVVEAQTDATMLLRAYLDPADQIEIQSMLSRAQQTIRVRNAGQVESSVQRTTVIEVKEVGCVLEATPSVAPDQMPEEDPNTGTVLQESSDPCAPKTQPTDELVEPTLQVAVEESDRVKQAIENLTGRKGEVLKLRLGIGVKHAFTVDETAEKLNLKRFAVYAAQRQAIHKLRRKLNRKEMLKLNKQLKQTKTSLREKRKVVKPSVFAAKLAGVNRAMNLSSKLDTVIALLQKLTATMDKHCAAHDKSGQIDDNRNRAGSQREDGEASYSGPVNLDGLSL